MWVATHITPSPSLGEPFPQTHFWVGLLHSQLICGHYWQSITISNNRYTPTLVVAIL